jgi:hypothetical protein
MSEWLLRKINTIAGIFAATVLLGVVFYSANLEIKDLDIWLHLGTGQYIVENHNIPQKDIFSATRQGAPWVDHEWLFQVFVYWAYKLGGMNGIINLTAVIISAIFILLYFAGKGINRDILQLGLLFLMLHVFQHRIMLRPDTLSLLFFVLFAMIIAFWAERKWALAAIFSIQVLWVNIHGFFILGPLLLSMALGAEWLKRHVKLPFDWNEIGNLTDEEYSNLKKALMISAIACLINPYFIKGALYPLTIIFSFGGDSKIFFQHIGELEPAISFGNVFDFGRYPAYKWLILISICSFFFQIRKIDISVLMLWSFALFASSQASRNIVFFAAVAYFVVLCNYSNFSWMQFIAPYFQKEKRRYLMAITMKVILIVFLLNYVKGLSYHGYFDFDKMERKSEYRGVSQRNFPIKAVDFLKNAGIKGNFWNDFNSGSYLIGRISPNIRVFIDGRTELYGGKFFDSYRRIGEGDKELFDQAVSDYALTGAFLNSVHTPPPKKLLTNLYNDPDWQMIYFNYDAVIFLKANEINQQWIEKHKIDLTQWQPPSIDLKKFKMRNVVPYQYMSRAYMLFNMGLQAQAEKEIAEAEKLHPLYTEPYKLQGEIYLQRKEYEKALEQLRKVLLIDPNYVHARYLLAECFYRLNLWDDSYKQAHRVLAYEPANMKAKIIMAMSLAALDKKREMLRIIEDMDSSDDAIQGIRDIGEIMVQKKDLDYALKVFHYGVEKSEDVSEFYELMAGVYERKGMFDESQKFALKAAKERENK